jgi:hypothetical protein
VKGIWLPDLVVVTPSDSGFGSDYTGRPFSLQFSLLPSESQTATSVMGIRRVQSGWHR